MSPQDLALHCEVHMGPLMSTSCSGLGDGDPPARASPVAAAASCH